jgi:hypothetical protein
MNRHRLFMTLGIVAALSLPNLTFGSSPVSTYILSTGTYGNGNVFIAFSNTIDEPGCSMAYVELAADSPSAKAALATATAALMSGVPVRVKTDGCLGGIPTFTSARSSYLVLEKP